MKETASNRKNWIIGMILLAILIILPFILITLGKKGEYWIWVTTEMLIMALFAASLNLILGFGGMVSFGHSAFYGMGAYTTALLIKKAGVPFLLAMAAAPVAAAGAAAVIGWFCVRRIGLYFSILTLAFSQLLYMIAFQWYTFTGGDDGIHGIARPAFLGPVSYYLFCLAILLLCLLVMRMIINSSYGLAIRTTRENSERAKFIGINVQRYQLINFIIAGGFAGISGGLITMLNRFAQTEFLHWSKSAEPIFASLVGGMYSLVGPVLGSTVLMLLKIILQQIHQSLVEIWALFLGLVLLIAVLFVPEGIVGLYQKIFKKTST
jgi:branched-chain amino acid transport system permease protein